MTKREVTGSYAGALDAILLDCNQFYPDDHLEWIRDSKRIHQAAVDRGVGFFTFDLPRLGDLLYEGLSTGRLPETRRVAYAKRRSSRDQRPRFFWALWSRVFDSHGLLLDDADPSAIFLLNTACQVWKKVEIPCKDEAVRLAYEEYFDIEERIPKSSPFWDGDIELTRRELGCLNDIIATDLFGDDTPKELLRVLEDCQRVADILVTELGFLNPEDVVGRHGPGAVSDLNRNGDKYAFPSWPERLDRLFPRDLHGVVNSMDSTLLDQSVPDANQLDEPVSYLTDVPKTQKAPRLIAEEPTCFQWVQQGLSDILRERSGRCRFGVMVDFFDQTPSQDRCREASLDGSSSTIDLSSASDRLSTWLVQRVFRANLSFLEGFIHTRTRYLSQDKFKHLPTVVRLRKFASMGSAMTFPVQSLVFASLAAGVGKSLHPGNSLDEIVRQVRVYGDDIIIPTTWVERLTAVLTAVGLKVNVGKSFSTGLIRESCGLHAWKGYNITPFRLRHPFSASNGASHLSWLQSCTNAHRMGLWRTSEFIEKAVTRGKRFLRVSPSAPQVGLLTFSRGLDPAAKVRWDDKLQDWFVSGFGLFIKSTQKETVDGPNCLLRLGRARYKTRRTLADLIDAPAVSRVTNQLQEAVSGAAQVRRFRVPLRLLAES